jgi:heme-degrading monooxygenase HmoA
VIAIIWRFKPADGKTDRFEAAYRTDGDWAALFRKGDGYVRTDLLRAEDGSYLTIDYWRAESDWSRFLERHRAAYDALDKACEGLTASEEKVGVFAAVG